MEKSVKSSAINYGLYLGLFLVALTVLAYAINLGLLTNLWFGIFIIIAIVAFGVVSVAKAKGLLNGFISFKHAFGTYFLTVLIGLLISTVVSYLLFAVIDTEAAETLKEQTIEMTITNMERFGAPVDSISEQVEKMKADNQYSIMNILKGLAGQLVLFSIIGLIVALIMKRSDPEQA